MKKAQPTQQAILQYIEESGSSSGPELAEHLGVTRQAVSLHLRALLAKGEIFKTGSTRNAQYFPKASMPATQRVKREYALAGLDESGVYQDLAVTLNLSRLSGHVESVLHYAFTEVLNNAIDHSGADDCILQIMIDANRIAFTVRDKGIGVFHSIAEKFDLSDEHQAMIELVKGKTTTWPEAHSGEGIFFVSKAADRFVLRSHKLQIEWDQFRGDVFVSEQRYVQGTLAEFELRTDSRTRLEQVFAEFAPEEFDFQFAKTRVLVKLLQREYISRTEAKRLLHNLDKFAEVELDMRDVTRIGQGFADEVFRVFHQAHPNTNVRAINTVKAVATMIQHVKGR